MQKNDFGVTKWKYILLVFYCNVLWINDSIKDINIRWSWMLDIKEGNSSFYKIKSSPNINIR